MKITFFTPALLSLFLVSCMVGPDFTTPRPEMPPSWEISAPPASQKDNLAQWWRIYQDPQLNKLVSRALNANLDLRTAVIRIVEARASLINTESALLPSLDSSLGTTRGSTKGLSSTANSSYSGSLDVSWELDLFGGNRRSAEAALADLYSTEADAIAVKTSLLAEVATNYFDWISYSEQLQVSEEQLVLQLKSLNIAEQQQQAGLTDMLDVEQARSQVSSTKASIPALKTRIINTKNSIALLLGTFPDDVKITMPSATTAARMPMVPVGLPSELLRRRPDIIQAEFALHAAVARIGVAVSDLYPRFSLSGGLSTGGRGDFAEWFRSSSSDWSLGGMVRWPIFSGYAIEANIKMKEAAADSSAIAYQKALITAVNEVENSLTTYAHSKIKLKHLQDAADSSRKAADISRRLYAEGETEFINVISAQRLELSSQEAVISTRQEIRQSVAKLAKALGGGWEAPR